MADYKDKRLYQKQCLECHPPAALQVERNATWYATVHTLGRLSQQGDNEAEVCPHCTEGPRAQRIRAALAPLAHRLPR